jgi:hypothetical protein
VGPTCQTPRATPVPRGSAPLSRGCHAPRSSRALKALSRPSRPPPDRLAPPARTPRPSRRRSDRAAVPTAVVRSRVARTVAVPPRPPRRSPIAVAPRRRPRADEPPVSSAVSHALVPCCRWLPVQHRRRTLRRRAPRVVRADQAGSRTLHRPRPSGPRTRAAPAPRARAVGRTRAVRLGRARFRPSGS